MFFGDVSLKFKIVFKVIRQLQYSYWYSILFGQYVQKFCRRRPKGKADKLMSRKNDSEVDFLSVICLQHNCSPTRCLIIILIVTMVVNSIPSLIGQRYKNRCKIIKVI